MSPVRNIAILGGGPAGATCGERLSRAGFQVTIYDEHLAWEKPCGGGLTQKALAAFPFLVSSPVPKKPINNVELISSDGKRARLRLDWPESLPCRVRRAPAPSSPCRHIRRRAFSRCRWPWT